MKIKFITLFTLLVMFVNILHSDEIGDVIILSKSGITNIVIKAYIDNITNIVNLNATNIVFLKKSGVSDDTIILLLNKNKIILKNQLVKEKREFDVESYDFFYKYYLLPRSLKYSYDLTNENRYRK